MNLSFACYDLDLTMKICLIVDRSLGKLPIFLLSLIYYYDFSSLILITDGIVDDAPGTAIPTAAALEAYEDGLADFSD